MAELFRRFCADERGAVGMEWAFVATILVLGAVVGVLATRQAALEPDERPALVSER
jgi:Flp pilus assembly pilin Flp